MEETADLMFKGVTHPKVIVDINHIDKYKKDYRIEFRFYVMFSDEQDEKGYYDVKLFLSTHITFEDDDKIKILSVGEFKFHKDITTDIVNNFITVSCPAIAIPFIRNFVANLTTSINIQQVIMPIYYVNEDDKIKRITDTREIEF